MKIIENTDDRLRLRFDGRDLFGTICDFNRRKNEAELVHTLLFIPFRRKRVALSDITDTDVKKRDRYNRVRYSPVLRLRRGRSLSFACRARDEALEAMRMIKSFLRLD